MKDFDLLQKEYLAINTKKQTLDILNEYALPNSQDLHNMICGYCELRLDDDTNLFETAESIDYFKYEKELCRIKRKL